MNGMNEWQPHFRVMNIYPSAHQPHVFCTQFENNFHFSSSINFSIFNHTKIYACWYKSYRIHHSNTLHWAHALFSWVRSQQTVTQFESSRMCCCFLCFMFNILHANELVHHILQISSLNLESHYLFLFATASICSSSFDVQQNNTHERYISIHPWNAYHLGVAHFRTKWEETPLSLPRVQLFAFHSSF